MACARHYVRALDVSGTTSTACAGDDVLELPLGWMSGAITLFSPDANQKSEHVFRCAIGRATMPSAVSSASERVRVQQVVGQKVSVLTAPAPYVPGSMLYPYVLKQHQNMLWAAACAYKGAVLVELSCSHHLRPRTYGHAPRRGQAAGATTRFRCASGTLPATQMGEMAHAVGAAIAAAAKAVIRA